MSQIICKCTHTHTSLVQKNTHKTSTNTTCTPHKTRHTTQTHNQLYTNTQTVLHSYTNTQ